MHVWERLKGFIIKAGTILFLACVVMWLLSSFGIADGAFGLVEDSSDSLMAIVGGAIAPIFAPLGWGEWQPVAAAISGFSAKEGIVSTMGVLANVAGDVEDAETVATGVGMWFPTALAGFSFLLFNLLILLVWQLFLLWLSRCRIESGSGLRSCSRMYLLMQLLFAYTRSAASYSMVPSVQAQL